MKLNRKGFMMAEVVVVSAVVLITLTTLYMSYNKILSLYEAKLSYEDSNLLYDLAYYRDYLIDMVVLDEDGFPVEDSNGRLMELLYNMKKDSRNIIDLRSIPEGAQYCYIYGENSAWYDRVFLIRNNHDRVSGNIVNEVGGTKQTLADYILYLRGNVDLTNTDYIMVLERHYNTDDSYKYAYLNLEIKL